MRCAAHTLFIAVSIWSLDCPAQSLAGDPKPTLKELVSHAAQGYSSLLEKFNSSAFAVASHVRVHAGSEKRWTTKDKDGNEIEQVVHHLLVVSWFRGDGRTALRYTVANDGRCIDVRHILNGFSGAHQSVRNKSLSSDELASLKQRLDKLPKSKSSPPIDRTVHVSFIRGDKWLTETYDASALPDEFENVMRILGERPETKGRHKKK